MGTTTPATVGSWLVELGRTLPGLLPGGPLPPTTRQRILVTVSAEHDSPWWGYVHRAWRDFLGGAPVADDEDRMMAFARASAHAGRPVDTTTLDVALPPAAVRSLRATVARGELANLATDAARRLSRISHRDRRDRRTANPAHLAWDAALTAAAIPLATTALAAATAARVAQRLAPPPHVEIDPDEEDANLLVHVVAQGLRAWLANAGVRLAVLRLPFAVSVALRDGRAEATVRIGQGHASVHDGVDPSAMVLVEGELGPILRAAAGNMLDQLGHVHIRRV